MFLHDFLESRALQAGVDLNVSKFSAYLVHDVRKQAPNLLDANQGLWPHVVTYALAAAIGGHDSTNDYALKKLLNTVANDLVMYIHLNPGLRGEFKPIDEYIMELAEHRS